MQKIFFMKIDGIPFELEDRKPNQSNPATSKSFWRCDQLQH
jgi:hypothetical protein